MTDQCPTCTHSKYNPFRVYVDGKITMGCIDDYHTGHLTPISASESWHNRKEAKKHRREVKEHLRTLKPYTMTTREPTANEPHKFQYANISNGLCWCNRASGDPIHV